MARKKGIDWDKVDLDRTLAEIAKEQGCSIVTVLNAKRVRGIGRFKPVGGQPSKIEWTKVDWRLKNREIAKLLKCHEVTVCRWRKKLTR